MAGNPLDTLCARLEGPMKYENGKHDLVMLQHKFEVVWTDGSEQTIIYIWWPSGHSAMAFTVGVPCGIAVQLLLDAEDRDIDRPGPYTWPGIKDWKWNESHKPIQTRARFELLELWIWKYSTAWTLNLSACQNLKKVVYKTHYLKIAGINSP